MKRKLVQKILSVVCAASVMLQIAAPAFAVTNDVEVSAPEAVVVQQAEQNTTEVPEANEPTVLADAAVEEPAWAHLVAGDANGNGHFGSTEPEAFVLSQADYTDEGFSFMLKLNSEKQDTRFRFVTKYVDDDNWGYIAYDGFNNGNWFYEYKNNGQGGYPSLGNLPALNKGDLVKITGEYTSSSLQITVENLTTGQTGMGIASNGDFMSLKAKSGKVGFGAARWAKENVKTDIFVGGLTVGEKTYEAADYAAMTKYQDKVGSWTAPEEAKPEPPVEPEVPAQGKLWYKITTGAKNTNSHNYGDASRNAPALALDQSRAMNVGETVSMTIKPSNNFAMFYTYIDDSNWLYVGYDPTSKWYYQYKINGAEQYPQIAGLPEPVPGEPMTMSVALDRETLIVNVNGKEVKVPNSKLLPFSESAQLKDKGHFGIKTLAELSFTDAKMGTADCMTDTWGFAADREGQLLTEQRSVVRTLTGVVTDKNGAAVAGASVTVGTHNTTTNAKGEYKLDGIEIGEYTMAVSKVGYTTFEATVAVTEDGANKQDVTLMPKADLDLSQFDTIASADMTAYIGKNFPVVARYVMKDGSVFRGNENAATMNSIRINRVNVEPVVQVLATTDTYRDYQLTVKDETAHLDLVLTVRISVAENTLTWQVTNLVKNEGCAKIATIELPQLNLLSVANTDANARFDGATMSSNTTVSGDRSATFTNGFIPNSSSSYLYAFLSTDTLSAGLESNSEAEGDRRIVRNDGADTMSLTSNVFYYERGDNNGQKYANTHPDTVYPVSELPCIKVAIAGDINGDGTIDWNDGALAYRKVMHRAYGNEVIKDIVNYRIVMNFASMAPDPFLVTANNLKKVYLATDGLPQALLLKGYGSEGHDSANSEYAHIADREGGVEDFQKLIQIAHQYNTEIGVHINAQEAYPEAKSFCPELIGGPVGTGNGWGWLDQSHVIDKHWDLASQARWKRLVQFYDRINNTHHLDRDWEKGEYVENSKGTVNATREQLKAEGEANPNNMDFIYLDVWYQDAWETRRIAEEFNDLGWRFSTEFATQGEYDSTWQHWATEGSYGGAGMKGFNSDIIRFIRNDQRDSQVLNYPSYGGTADNPLLGGYELYGFEGWGSQRDFGDYIINTFNSNLPTKFLQHYVVTDWTNYEGSTSPVGNHEKQITLRNEAGDTVVVTRNEEQRADKNIERTITLNGKVVLDDVTYLLPWTDNQDGTEKLYHWNLEGGVTTWDLVGEWADMAEVIVYKVTDQGRVEPQTVKVNNGQITLTAEAAVPYVIVKTAGVKTLKADYGEMDYVVDPGFDGYAGNGSKLDKADWSGDITDPSVTVELSVTEDQRLQFASPAKDVAVSTTIRNLVPGKDYVAEIYVQNDTNLPATLEVNTGKNTVSVWAGHSYVKNYVRCDNKSAYSSMQRMQVSFVAESDTAVLTLKRAAGAGNTYMDGIRIVQQTLNNYREDGSFVQDFESVVQGLYPFVLGPAQGVDDPRTHLAEKHAPYTQYGWHDRVVDDVIDGNWSLKHHNQSTGIIYQTLPQNFRFEPGKVYTVEFDYQTGSDKAYAMVIGDDAMFTRPTSDQLLPITGGKEVDGKMVGNTQHVTMMVEGAESGNTWIGLYAAGGVAGGAFGQMDFILDNLVIREDKTAVSVNITNTKLYKGETADIIVRAADPKGGVAKWENTDPSVAVIEGSVLKALKAGTTTLTAVLTNGKTAVFDITVMQENNVAVHGVGAVANSQETTGEGMDNGIAYAAADGDESTYWHTEWTAGNFRVSETNPAVLCVDLGADLTINGIKFLQRPSGPNGIVKKYSYRILDADKNEIAAGGPSRVPAELASNGKWVEVPFETALPGAHYIEISVLEGHGGFAALAEVQAIQHVVVADEATLENMDLKYGETKQMVIAPKGEGNVLKGLVWATADTDIIKLDQDGNVTGLKNGKATVTVTNAAGLKATAVVTVTGEPAAVKTVQITKAPNKTEYKLGEELDLTGMEITITYTDGTTKVVTENYDQVEGLKVLVDRQNNKMAVAVGKVTSNIITVKFEKEKPVEPTEKPVEPTEKPVEPTAKPVEPVAPTAAPTSAPAGGAAPTGDVTNMGMWVMLLILSGALAGGVYFVQKKRKNQ